MSESTTYTPPEIAINGLFAWREVDGTETIERILRTCHAIDPDKEHDIQPRNDGFIVITVLHDGKRDEAAVPRFRSCVELFAALDPECGVARPIREVSAPTATMYPDSPRYEKHSARRDKNYELIRPLVDDPDILTSSKKRTRAIAARAKEAGRSRTEVRTYVRRYFQGGQVPDALLPEYATRIGEEVRDAPEGEKRGPKPKNFDPERDEPLYSVTPADRLLLRKGLEKFYNKNAANSLKAAYYDTVDANYYQLLRGEKVRLPSDQRPSFRQFLYLYRKEFQKDPTKFIVGKIGIRRQLLRKRPIIGNMTQEGFGPGDLYEIDSTPGDIALVDDLGRPIGRATTYLVPDVFSHIITGFSVSLEEPSYIALAMALENAFTDKVAFCALHGIDITPEQWPTHYMPNRLKADRGEAIWPQTDRRIVNALNIPVTNLPAWRADWKSIVERWFGRLNQCTFHRVRGGIRKKYERGDKNPHLDAVLTLAEYMKVVIHTILWLNSQPLAGYPLDEALIAEGVTADPISLWRWGMKHRTAGLRRIEPEMAQMHLLPRDDATITAGGLLYRGLLFTTPGEGFTNWMTTVASRGTIKVRIAYDPRLVDAISIEPTHGGPLIPCSLRQDYRQFSGYCWVEVDKHREYRSESEREHNRSNEEKSAEHKLAIDNIMADATARQAGLVDPAQSKRSRLGGLKQNRNEARQNVRQKSGWIKTESAESIPSNVVALPDQSANAVAPAVASQSPLLSVPPHERPPSAEAISAARLRELLSDD